MIAVDTNILVHAHRSDSSRHERAKAALDRLIEAPSRWAIPWPCVHEFLAVVTNVRIFPQPTPTPDATSTISDLVGADQVLLLGETVNHLDVLAGLLDTGAAGPKVHDARIAAICLGHGIEELWTLDRDFSYFPQLRTRNPLV